MAEAVETPPLQAPPAPAPEPDAPTPGEIAAWEKEALKEEQAASAPAMAPADIQGVAEALTGIVVYAHDLLADVSRWPGWSLTESEKNMWHTLSQAVGAKLHVKDLPLMLAVIGVLVMEASKTARYIGHIRSNRPPKTAPAPEKDRRTSGAPAEPFVQTGVIPLESLGPVPGGKA